MILKFVDSVDFFKENKEYDTTYNYKNEYIFEPSYLSRSKICFSCVLNESTTMIISPFRLELPASIGFLEFKKWELTYTPAHYKKQILQVLLCSKIRIPKVLWINIILVKLRITVHCPPI